MRAREWERRATELTHKVVNGQREREREMMMVKIKKLHKTQIMSEMN